MTKVANQTGVIMDAISAGPIAGLVNGNKSIMLNDVPIVNIQQSSTTSTGIVFSLDPVETIASTTLGLNEVRIPKSNFTEEQLIDLETGNEIEFYIWVEGAGRKVVRGPIKSQKIKTIGNNIVSNTTDAGSLEGLIGSDDDNFTNFTPPAGHISNISSDPNATPGTEGFFHRECIDIASFDFDSPVSGYAPQTENSFIKQTFVFTWGQRTDFADPNVQGKLSPVRSAISGLYDNASKFGSNDNTNIPRLALDSTVSANTKRPFARKIRGRNHPLVPDVQISPDAYTEPTWRTVSYPDHALAGFSAGYIFDFVAGVQSFYIDGEDLVIVPDTSNSASSFLPRPPAATVTDAKAYVFLRPPTVETIEGEDNPTPTIRGYAEFRNGLRYQTPITTIGNSPVKTSTAINPNIGLDWASSAGGTDGPTIITSSGTSPASLGLSAQQANSVDSIKFNLVFPQGLFAQKTNGDLLDGMVDITVNFKYKKATEEPFQQARLLGHLHDTGFWPGVDRARETNSPEADPVLSSTEYTEATRYAGSGRIYGQTRAPFSKEFYLDVSNFAPFSEFEIEFIRNSPLVLDDYKYKTNSIEWSGIAASCQLQYVQAQFSDHYSYPLTAYAAVKYAGSEFETIPQRTYHCKGLIVDVPSNYITREEDKGMGGTGVASYTRIADANKTITANKVNAKQLYVNTLSGSIIVGSINNSDGTVGYRSDAGQGGSISSTDIPSGIGSIIRRIEQFETSNAIRFQFHDDYTMFGAQKKLFDEVDSISITISGTTYTWPEINSTNPAYNVVTLQPEDGVASNVPDFVVGDEYAFTLNFKNDVIRPSDYVIWDGTFRKAYTNNPAWVFLNLLVNKEYGLGSYIRPEDIDIFELYTIARYCDELVSDGKGGLEPRMTCNCYITKNTEAYKVLKDLASVFRGMTVWDGGKILPVQDRPKEALYLFNQSNVIEGNFAYEYTASRSRQNSIEVTWNDPTQKYAQDVVIIDDVEHQEKVGRVESKQVIAFGCTSKAQAKRVGEWHLATNLRETQLIKFKTSINSFLLGPGDIFAVQDSESNERIIAGGRIKNSDNSIITLDRPVELLSSKNYIIYVQIPQNGYYLLDSQATIFGTTYTRGDLIKYDTDGNLLVNSVLDSDEIVDDFNNSVKVQKSEKISLVKKEIVNSVNAPSEFVQQVVISSPIDLQTDIDTNDTFTGKVFGISENDLEAKVQSVKLYRLLSLKENDAFNLEIVGAYYDETKFSDIDTKNASFNDPFNIYNLGGVPVPQVSGPTAFLAPDFSTLVGGNSSMGGYDLTIQWTSPTIKIEDSNGVETTQPANNIAGYYLEHGVENASSDYSTRVETIVGVNNTSFTFRNVNEGTYEFFIKSFTFDSPPRVSAPFYFRKQVTAPVGVSKIGRIPRGGEFNSPVNFTSAGTVSVLNSSYIFKSVSNFPFSVSSATTNQKEQSFSTMSNDSTAFWFYSHVNAKASTSDPWKAVQVHTDSTAKNAETNAIFDDTGFQYIKELGAANNGLSTLTSGGTLTITDIQQTTVQAGFGLVVTTSAEHKLKGGDVITITGVVGMTEVNSQTFTVRLLASNSKRRFMLFNSSNTAIADGGAVSAYTSGGTVTRSTTITASITSGAKTIVGKNTSFLTDFSTGDLVKLSTSSSIGTEVTTSEYFEVEQVTSDHTLVTTSPATRAYTDASIFQQLLKVSVSNDSILAEVTKSSGGEYSIEYDSNLKGLDTSTGLDVNQTNVAEAQLIDVAMSHDTLPHAETIVTNTINTPTQAANRTINALATIIGKIGHKGPEIAITNVDLSQNPIVVTAGAAHGLYDNCKVVLHGFTDTVELNNNQYFVKIGDESDANTTTKFRLFNTLNRGAVQSITVSSGGSGFNASTTTNNVAVTSATGGEGSGLTATVVTNGSGVITSVTPTSTAKGKNFAINDTLTLGTVPNGGSPVAPSLSIPTNGVDWELTDSVNGGSGFTSGGSYTATKMQDINPCTLSLKATISEGPNAKTILGREIVNIQPYIFSHYLIPVSVSYNIYSIGYGTASATVDGTVSGTTVTADVAMGSGLSDATALTVDNASGTITTGMTVTGTGIVGPCVVQVTNGSTSVTLSNKQTLSNDVTLTFKKTVVAVDGVSGTIRAGMKVTGGAISGDVFVATGSTQTSIILDDNITDLLNDTALSLTFTFTTFSDLVAGYNLYVGSLLAQASPSNYSSNITFVQNLGNGLAQVNAGYDTNARSNMDITSTYSISSGITIKEMSPQTTLVDSAGLFSDKSISISGSTGAVTTVGDTTVELQGKTDSPSVAKLSTVTNLMADDDIVVTTSEPHGFQTGTPISFSNVILSNVFGFTTDEDQPIIPTNGVGMNNGVVYYVSRTSATTFKVAITSGGSDFVHGRAFFAGDEQTGTGYAITNGLVVNNTASIIDEAVVRVDATT